MRDFSDDIASLRARLGEARQYLRVDAGREREAASIALAALAKHLPRYERSLTNYARELSG